MEVDDVNLLLSLGVIALQVFTLFLLLVLLSGKSFSLRLRVIVIKYTIPLAFALSVAAVSLTFYYSELVGYPPCGLCWMQRVFLYPIPVILGVALYRKDKNIAPYILALSILGALFAFYQYYIQMASVGWLPCPASSVSSDCSKRYIFEFGYITLPMISATFFIFITVLFSLYAKLTKPSESSNP